MTKINLSQEYITNNYECIDEKVTTHYESKLFLHRKKIYKILEPIYNTESRKKTIKLLEQKKFPYASNIIDSIYDKDKLIGCTSFYLPEFIPLSKTVSTLPFDKAIDLINKFIIFYESVLDSNINYWDIHLNNLGLSNNELVILDMDSIEKIDNIDDLKYTYKNLFELLISLLLNINIKRKFVDYENIIFKITDNIDYRTNQLDLYKIKEFIETINKKEINNYKKILKKDL